MIALRSPAPSIRPALVAVALMCLGAQGQCAGPAGAFLEEHCIECHDAETQKGGFRLDHLETLKPADAAKGWGRILARLEAGEMPPVKKPRPPQADLVRTVASLKTSLAEDAKARREHGRTHIRRLNRLEYENTVRDLLHIDAPLRDLLPEDDLADGFDNGSKALSISPVHIQRYMEAAERALETAMIHGSQPEVKKLSVSFDHKDENTYQNLGHGNNTPFIKVREGKILFYNAAHIEVPIHSLLFARQTSAAPGRYRVTITAHTEDDEQQPLVLFLKTRRSKHDFGYYDAPVGKPETIVVEHTFKPGDSVVMMPYRMAAVRRVRGLSVYPVKDKPLTGPALVIDSYEAEGPLYASWPPPSHETLFGGVPLRTWKELPPDVRMPSQRKTTDFTPVSDQPEADARRLLGRFLSRAFRRPVSEEELQPYLAMVHDRLERKESFEVAMFDAYRAVLCSPDFLFLVEEPGPLDDHALASRLSYFLTRSAPDEMLRAAADRKQLRDPVILRREAERLLASPRSEAFVNDFLDHWLRLRDLDATMPDKDLFPEFYENWQSATVDGLLRKSIIDETRFFFTDLLRNDGSLLHLLDSDYTFLNSRLAEFYGLPPMTGVALRRAQLPADSVRGGVLTQASVLKVTANGANTSPVLRGGWVLESILGRPPQPPPPDAGAIEPDTRGATTIREQLLKHQSNATCANCHRQIDPPGFALEAFDPVGQFRTYYRATEVGVELKNVFNSHGHRVKYRQGPPVDASGVLAGGQTFDGPREFKRLLRKEAPFVARNLAAKLVTFATGHHTEPGDVLALDRVVAEAAKRDLGLRTLILAAIGSEIFRNK